MKFRINEKRKNGISLIKGLIPEFAKEINIEESFDIDFLKQKWPEIVGNILSTHSFPHNIFAKTLTIKVDHSVFSNDMIMMKKIILDKINSIGTIVPIKDFKVELIKSGPRRKK